MRETRSRILSLILTVAILSTFIVTPAFAASSEDKWDGSVASSFAGGSGTEPDPYLIATGALTRPKFARQTKHQVFFSFRNIALHFIINEMLAG